MNTIRAILRRFGIAGLALVLTLTACGGGDGEPTADDTTADDEQTQADGDTPEDPYLALCPPEESPDTMVLGIWGGPHEPVLDEALAEFEDKVGTDVTYTQDSTGDRITKLNAEAGSPSIDVPIVPINEVPALLRDEVILPSQDDIPNVGDLKPSAEIPGGYGISLFQSVIAYNPEFVDEPPTSWLDLFDERFSGHLGWGDIPGANGYANLTMVARAMGGSEDDLTPAIEQVGEHADDILTFISFGPAAEPQVESGELWVYPQLSGVLQDFKERGGPIELTVPEEGGPILMNTAVLPAGARHEGCSKALIGWLLEDVTQETYAENLFYAPATTTVELSGDLQDKVYPIDESTAVDVDWQVISENVQDIIDTWNRAIGG